MGAAHALCSLLPRHLLLPTWTSGGVPLGLSKAQICPGQACRLVHRGGLCVFERKREGSMSTLAKDVWVTFC